MASTPVVAVDSGDVVGFAVTTVELGERRLLVAVADTSDLRARGLMEVGDLGDLDGMVFVFGAEISGAFTMRDTLIDLDIAFFDGEGILVDQFTMTPCEAESCPSYSASAPFAYALEMPAGQMGPLGPETTLTTADS